MCLPLDGTAWARQGGCGGMSDEGSMYMDSDDGASSYRWPPMEFHMPPSSHMMPYIFNDQYVCVVDVTAAICGHQRSTGGAGVLWHTLP